jgi:hypothetical protein
VLKYGVENASHENLLMAFLMVKHLSGEGVISGYRKHPALLLTRPVSARKPLPETSWGEVGAMPFLPESR